MNKKTAKRFLIKNEEKMAKMKLYGIKPSPGMLKRIKEATRILIQE